MSTPQVPVIERTLRGHRDSITSVAFHPVPSDLAPRKQHPSIQQVQIASAAADGGLILWNYQLNRNSSSSSINNEVKAFRFPGHNSTIHHLSYAPTGNLLASCSSDSVRLWVPRRSPSGESVILKGHTKTVRCVEFSHHRSNEDSLIVSCSDDKTLKLWGLPSKAFRCSMVGHTNWVRSCKFSPDSRFVVSGGDDGNLKLWDCNNGEEVLSYRFPSSIISSSSSTSFEGPVSVRQVDFHPTGNMFAASGSDGNVHVYDLRSDKVINSLPEPNTSYITTKNMNFSPSISFHPKGGLMTSSNDGKFKLYDVRNMNCAFSVKHITPRQSDCNYVGKTSQYCCNFSSDGSKMVTGNKQVLVWKTNLESSRCNLDKPGTIPCTDKQMQKVECDTKSRIGKNKGNTAILETQSIVKDVPLKDITLRNEQKPNISSDEIRGTKRIFDHIIGQLDFITSFMVAMEKRLSIQEEALATLQLRDVDNKK